MAGLNTPLAAVLGARSATALAADLDLHTLGHLLRHYPRRFAERGELTDIAGLQVGEHVTVLAEVRWARARRMQRRRGTVLEVTIGSGSRTLSCTFFNQPWRERELLPGRRGLFAGKVTRYRRALQLAHPDYQLVDGADDESTGEEFGGFAAALIPVYPATKELPSWVIARCVSQALDLFDDPADPLPEVLRAEHGLVDLGAALRRIHRPPDRAAHAAARHRLVFDEALALQLALAQRRRTAAARPARTCPTLAGGLREAFDARLPFVLTAGQRDVGAQISDDLAGAHPMNRLLQGDVGAGKTVVALRAMLQVVDGGRQAVLLAPTEVLAAQHARSLRALLGPLAAAGELGGAERATQLTLLTGSLGTRARRQALADAASGTAGIVVGTHALLQESVDFADLGLVVVDEQHRFGVEQRDALRHRPGGHTPHVLVMTATPIPRTVAMTVFGDLELSTLAELPAGRAPIRTAVVPAGEKPAWLDRAWQRVREEVAAGHQAYVVCPRIGESASAGEDVEPDVEDVEPDGGEERRPPLAVLDVAPLLAAGPLAGMRLGVLHGRLPAEEKDEVMRTFAAGQLDVLVATTVVEVGVDVPNATVMVIMDGDRFGLSQLHQLRGRVGRGSAAGLCLLVTEVPAETTARERLDAVAGTTDGFELARLDLELRREGDVLGERQSGRRSGLRLLSLRSDEPVILAARAAARRIVDADPELSEHPGLAGMVADLVDEQRARYLEKV